MKELGTQDGVLSVQIEGLLYSGNTDSVRQDIADLKLRSGVDQVRIQTESLEALDSTARDLVDELEAEASSSTKTEEQQKGVAQHLSGNELS